VQTEAFKFKKQNPVLSGDCREAPYSMSAMSAVRAKLGDSR